MQHPQPEDVYPEFPPQPQSLHLHAHDLQQREMGTDYPIYPISSQPADRPTTVSATQNSLTWILLQQHEHVYPTLFRLAIDVLPAQATAVPCERVFSSSKETCTQHHSQLGPTTMEMLQILKHLYQQERLDFTTGILAVEDRVRDITHSKNPKPKFSQSHP